MHHIGKIYREMFLIEPVAESVPLHLFCRDEMCRECRDFGRQLGLTVRQCLCNRFREYVPFEIEQAGKQLDIMEIFHTAVQLPQGDHGLEFLGDGTFPTVTQQTRRRKIQQRG